VPSTNLVATRGATVTLDVTVVNSDSSAYDLSGASQLLFTAKRSYLEADAYAVAQKSLGQGVYVDDAPAGTCHVVLQPADTVSLDVGMNNFMLYWDLKLFDSSGEHVLAYGQLTLTPAVTQTV
jgi:hypothetical protein